MLNVIEFPSPAKKSFKKTDVEFEICVTHIEPFGKKKKKNKRKK